MGVRRWSLACRPTTSARRGNAGAIHIYRWDALAEDGYGWWVARVRQALQLVDMLRLDHFRGFKAYWEIPGDADTAVSGRWTPGPGEALFTAIRQALGDVPLVAEDLGDITPDVVALRKRLRLPGMRVLQFGFGGDAENEFLPHNYTRNTVVYTGTHDNDTTRGWFDALTKAQRHHVPPISIVTGSISSGI